MLTSANIKSMDAYVENHNASSRVERYHEYLRQVFHKIRLDTPIVPIEEALTLAVHDMSSTAGR